MRGILYEFVNIFMVFYLFLFVGIIIGIIKEALNE